MTTDNLQSNLAINLQKQAEQHWVAGRYENASLCYEQVIEIQSENKSNYWYLGLMLLLLEKEEEAQTTWLWAMADGDAEQIEKWSRDLVDILATEANRQMGMQRYRVAWAIRQHIRGINPEDINNLLHLIGLSIQLEFYTGKEIIEWGILELLQGKPDITLDQYLLVNVWDITLKYAPLLPSARDLTAAMVPHIQKQEIVEKFVSNIIQLSYELAYVIHQHNLAINYCELGLQVCYQDIKLLSALSNFHTDVGQYSQAINYAKKAYKLVTELPDLLYQNYLIIKSMMSSGGYWQEVFALMSEQKELLGKLYQEQPKNLGVGDRLVGLYATTYYFPYLQDNPQENIKLRQQVTRVCQANLENACQKEIHKYQSRYTNIPAVNVEKNTLKIGYICSCLRRHSVGWLARSLFKHHDRERFKIYAYMLGATQTNDDLQKWYIHYADIPRLYGLAQIEIAEQIYQDEIDILIDIDSLTITSTCGITALKPAPVQATWLGWDASEVPTIDYYIADPYVLPENAQEYYQTKIWRLPQTYLAVDGFEVSVPSITRADLEIPNDAVVYLGVQRGPKYNPQIAKLQMQILKEVPHSYFLIKGFGEQDSLNRFFFDIAEKEGVFRDRIKFIPRVTLEETHRANLQIADVVLDTYPYNGATTTLETLWMGIPMVTRVGEQFAARNSYTMMMNVGLTEGIAWTDEEYVEWGIRLGKDEALRQQISWKLRKSRQTSPLWNAKQFTVEMEKAYEQMWQIYMDGK
ncbi:MAG: O-linked N-acetylglucosamine transferase, SPINDLY family protein [Cyanobacteriota bacterium]|nr:O-linked N-acetylglucosamine transferase, SPINDLY family protein [Cyanobacteriota bacterium]